MLVAFIDYKETFDSVPPLWFKADQQDVKSRR